MKILYGRNGRGDAPILRGSRLVAAVIEGRIRSARVCVGLLDTFCVQYACLLET